MRVTVQKMASNCAEMPGLFTLARRIAALQQATYGRITYPPPGLMTIGVYRTLMSLTEKLREVHPEEQVNMYSDCVGVRLCALNNQNVKCLCCYLVLEGGCEHNENEPCVCGYIPYEGGCQDCDEFCGKVLVRFSEIWHNAVTTVLPEVLAWLLMVKGRRLYDHWTEICNGMGDMIVNEVFCVYEECKAVHLRQRLYDLIMSPLKTVGAEVVEGMETLSPVHKAGYVRVFESLFVDKCESVMSVMIDYVVGGHAPTTAIGFGDDVYLKLKCARRFFYAGIYKLYSTQCSTGEYLSLLQFIKEAHTFQTSLVHLRQAEERRDEHAIGLAFHEIDQAYAKIRARISLLPPNRYERMSINEGCAVAGMLVLVSNYVLADAAKGVYVPTPAHKVIFENDGYESDQDVFSEYTTRGLAAPSTGRRKRSRREPRPAVSKCTMVTRQAARQSRIQTRSMAH